MSALPDALRAPERVLPTLNPDGSRRWLRPKPSHGRWWRSRRTVAIVLMAIFFAIPYLDIGGRPAVLLDLPARRFTLLGTTFMPTEMVLFMLVVLAATLAVLLFTALFGRVWCGWACPQTVYMEYLFRPFERWIEGGWLGSDRLDKAGGLHWRRAVKYAVYLVFALFLAHTFLAYFVPVEELARWVRRSPFEHPTSFLVMAFTTALILFDFGWFREQTCLVACPYGRLQSALLDRRSLIVGYDSGRGEPRMKGIRDRVATAGDCIDCRLCVITCPTGIDIRGGLQMECIHCTQCMDACDRVMRKVGKPEGLIRYTSIAGLAGAAPRTRSARRILYPAALGACLVALAIGLVTRTHADVTLLRGLGAPFTLAPSGAVVNQVRVKLGNRADATRSYRLELLDAPRAELIVPRNPLPVAPSQYVTQSVFVMLPPAAFRSGERAVRFRISDDHGWSETYRYRLAGPTRTTDGGARP